MIIIATTWMSADGSVACKLDQFYVSSSLKSLLSACVIHRSFCGWIITLTGINTILIKVPRAGNVILKFSVI